MYYICNMIETKTSPSFFYLIGLHYNYISIMDRQEGDKYRFRPISLIRKKGAEDWEYKFEIEGANIDADNEFSK